MRSTRRVSSITASRRIALLALLAITAVAALFASVRLARRVRQVAASAVVAQGRAQAADWTCLERAIRAQVPRGAPVVVGTQEPLAAQRLAELAYPWADVRTEADDPAFVLRFRENVFRCDALEVVPA